MNILPKSPLRAVALSLIAISFTGAGLSHFISPEFFVDIMPPYLPAHLELVYLSGVFEILGGLGVLHPKWRKAAGIGLLLLLIAVFPANIHMALHPELFAELPALALYLRLPLQGVIAWLVWWGSVSQNAQTSV